MSEIIRAAADDEIQTCPNTAYQSATVCVPITVTPFAKTGSPITKCCGDPVITTGVNVCDGKKNGTCVFTVTQDLCITVPVEFGATAVAGDSYVSCNGASADNICLDCDAADDTLV